MKGIAKITIAILVTLVKLSTNAQAILQRVEPASWWVGMANPNLQLLVQAPNIAAATVSINYPGIHVDKVHRAENKNFLFIDLVIDKDTKAGNFTLAFQLAKKKKITYTYTLHDRQQNQVAHQGINQSDVIYLLTPDRFVNGNPNNDETNTLHEKKNRALAGGRHGGDLPGILSKLDYLYNLGITTLWINPVLENDMPAYSYHGYATTNYYKTDTRFGSNEDYRKLADELHAKKMKLIMDMVLNHCGSQHWWMKDMPFADWVHNHTPYLNTNHAIASLSDPHGAEQDRTIMEKGWFVEQMPDLNQENPFVATYLIQNSIWWIEYAGLDGIRQDTYPYNNKDFMVQWAKQIHRQYPDLFLVGESWVDNEALEAYWAGHQSRSNPTFNSFMTSMTDFPLCFAIQKAFKKDGDLTDLYNVISKDFLYTTPEANMIFADNHDMDRLFYTLGQNVAKTKLALTFLLTTRGIPQLYYGSEINMSGHGNHGDIRQDFPGGWPTDARNAFTQQGRTPPENELFFYLQNLLQWRKQNDAIHNGTLKHFVPDNNLYVYNRKSNKESVVVMINNTDNTKTIETTHYNEILKGYDSATDIITNKKITNLHEIEIPPNTALVLQLTPPLKAQK